MDMKKIAAFDFDGTITTRDTLPEFIRFSRGNVRFMLGFILYAPLIIAYKLKLYPNWKVKEKIFSHFYKGISIDRFNQWGNGFDIKIKQIVRPKAIDAIKKYKDTGASVIIVSASLENWIAPFAASLDIDYVLATKPEIDGNNCLTGRFLTKNCYGREKVDRILALYPCRAEYELHAFGDSKGDLELISFADYGEMNKFL